VPVSYKRRRKVPYLIRRIRIIAARAGMRQRFGMMYAGAVVMQALSIIMVALHDLFDRYYEGVGYPLLVAALFLQVTVVACLVLFRSILIAQHHHEQHMRADPSRRGGAPPNSSP
jgi:diguanylate cyclase